MTCIDAPPGISELELANLKTVSSIRVRPPRIQKSPVSFECCFLTSISLGSNQAIIAGQVLHAFIEDRFVQNPDKGMVDTTGLR